MSSPETVRPPRETFGPSVWFTLSIGRRQKAEPRRLLPLISRAGGLARGDVGAIRMAQNATHVEIAADRAEAFLAALGPDRTLQDGIRVGLSEGPPAPGATRPVKSKHPGDAKPRRPPEPGARAPKRRPNSRSH